MNGRSIVIRNILNLLGIFFIGLNPALAQTVSSSLSFYATTTPAVVSSTDDGFSDSSSTPGRPLINEPTIRVGLGKFSGKLKFTSDFDYEVFSGDESKGMLPAGEVATLNYQNGVYSFKSDSLEFAASNFLRLVPADPANYFALVNFERKLNGRKNINFNVYRGTLEYRYSPRSKAVFIINELPLEEYVAGVAETSDGAAPEFIKALMVAARSYAYSFISNLPATDKRMFDVYGSTVDQLYLGYNSELFMPNAVHAAAETAGEMVAYNGAPVMTPYFTRSDGRTRDWKKAWGAADRPWLKSVTAIYDKGRKMLGHGVGMSNHDAIKHAAKDGWAYEQILGYYYTGTKVEKVY